MSNIVNMKRFAFGAGAFREEGTPMEFELDNCKPTYWIRPLDAMRIAKLQEKDVDLDNLGPMSKQVEKPLLDKDGSQRFDEDGERMTTTVQEISEGMHEWMARSAPHFADFCEELIVKFEGLKREDGTIIECNPETIRGHGGYPDFISALVIAGTKAAKAQAKNSASLSDGKSAKPETAGELISETVIEKA